MKTKDIINELLANGPVQEIAFFTQIIKRLNSEGEHIPNHTELDLTIKKMIVNHELIAIEYESPNLPYRTKRIFFKAGTIATIHI